MEPDQPIAPPADGQPHHPMLSGSFREIRSWWSVRCGVIGILILTGIPALSDQFPNIAPSLVSWFPKHGAQWVPVLGAAIAILSRIVSQAYIADQIRKLFKVKGDVDANS